MSRGVAVGPVSRADHDTVVGAPGSSVASIVVRPAGRVIYATHPNIRGAVKRNSLEPWSVTWLFERTQANE